MSWKRDQEDRRRQKGSKLKAGSPKPPRRKPQTRPFPTYGEAMGFYRVRHPEDPA